MATRVGVKTAACAILATCAVSASVPALALGLGEIEMRSFLNEPLQAQVELLDTRELTSDDIRIRLAGVEDFDRLGVDRSFFLTSIQFEIDLDPDTGRGVIRLSTEDAVVEPYLDLIVEARWPSGRVLREYTVLVDPPAYQQEMISVSATERVRATNPDKPASAQPASAITQTRESGDRVSTRESSLPPGQMPERAFSADTASQPSAGNRYMVRRDETLWQIASQGRPQGISVQQAMLDIQRVNPEAFIDGNINRIKAGYIIYLPAAGEVSSDDLAAAIEEVREQNREFRERTAPGVSAAATLRVSADADRGAAVSDSAGASTSDASRAPEPGLATDDGGATGAGAMTDAAAGRSAADAAMNAQLGQQMREMSERLDTLEQIVSLKDEQIATLEEALREAREAAAVARSQPGAPATPTPPPAPSTTPSSTSSAIPWLPIAGGLLIAVLAVVLFLRRRVAGAGAVLAAGGREDEKNDVFAGVSLQRDALDDEEVAQPSTPAAPAGDTLAGRIAAAEKSAAAGATEPAAEAFDRGGSRGYGERKHDDYIDEGSAGDALAEADIYIAYGRYMQAIELLDTAISDEPNNTAYRLKLIELYVDMGEEESAAGQLDELRRHGDADAVARGEALVGSDLPPAAASQRGDLRAPVELPEIDEEIANATAPEAGSLDSDDGDDWDVALPAGDVPEEVPVDEDGTPLELDLDDGDAFESYGTDEPEKQRVSVDEAAEAMGDGRVAAVHADDEEEDWPSSSSNRVATDEPLEFDELEIEDDPAGDTDYSDDSLNLDGDDDLDFTDALEGTGGQGASMADENGDDMVIADDADQVATKLDLARAYLDMGDSEGARGILEEVSGAGSDEQKREASALLERIG